MPPASCSTSCHPPGPGTAHHLRRGAGQPVRRPPPRRHPHRPTPQRLGARRHPPVGHHELQQHRLRRTAQRPVRAVLLGGAARQGTPHGPPTPDGGASSRRRAQLGSPGDPSADGTVRRTGGWRTGPGPGAWPWWPTYPRSHEPPPWRRPPSVGAVLPTESLSAPGSQSSDTGLSRGVSGHEKAPSGRGVEPEGAAWGRLRRPWAGPRGAPGGTGGRRRSGPGGGRRSRPGSRYR